jgi:hypothetical protein
MNTLKVLLWKEWRQQRWFLLAGVILFWLVPFIGMIVGLYTGEPIDRSLYHMREFVCGLTLSMGGFFAIILAVGIVCNELNSDLSNFWQSRPIGLAQWLLVKYFFGLAVVIISCVLCFFVLQKMFAIAAPSEFYNSDLLVPIYHSFTLLLVYSTAFFIGVLVRQTVNAAVLSVCAGLVIYFLPLVFPPLGFLNVFTILLEGDAYKVKAGIVNLTFIYSMLVGCAGMLFLTFAGMKLNWRIRMEKQLMFWSLGGVVVILLASAGFQLNANLTCEREIPRPQKQQPGEYYVYYNVVMTGKTQGVLAFQGGKETNNKVDERNVRLYRFDLSSQNVFAGPPICTDSYDAREQYIHINALNSPKISDRLYLVDEVYSKITRKRKEVSLSYVLLNPQDKKPMGFKLDLTSKFANVERSSLTACFYKDSIYVLCGPTLVRISLANRDKPEITDIVRSKSEFGQWMFLERYTIAKSTKPLDENNDPLTLRLHQIPGLNDRERLEVTLLLEEQRSWGRSMFTLKDDLLVYFEGETSSLGTWRLSSLNSDQAVFLFIGRLRATPLERFMFLISRPEGQMIIDHDRVWLNGGTNLMVYDIHDPATPRRIGHFATHGQRFFTMVSLPDGKILLGGDKLYIISPPKR